MMNIQQQLAITHAMGPILAIDQARLPQIALLADSEPQAAFSARATHSQPKSSTAVIDIAGPITHRPTWWSVSTMEISALLDKALKSGAPNIVLSWDSPGGTVSGVKALSDKIYAARQAKPIISVVNSLAASAAYWLASAATEVVAVPHSDLGSIGVFAVHEDVSKALDKEGVSVTLIHAGKFKVEGHPFGPLDDEAKAEMQRRVDSLYADFIADVARNRGYSQSTVRAGFGQGRLVQAERSIVSGMADRIATLEQVLGRLGVGSSAGARAARCAYMHATEREDRIRALEAYKIRNN
jgi:signal peptide peptidase SppA